mgnify:CR=1 FL=1
MPRPALRELAELAAASLVAAVVGLSLYLDARQAFRLTPGQIVVLSIGTFLIHDLAHRSCARLMGLEGRFRLSLTGSAFSLLIAGVQNGISILAANLTAALGLEPVVLKLVPYRFLAPGTVTVTQVCKRPSLGRVASAGPLTNLALGWALLLLAFVIPCPATRELAVLASAFNAYTALTAILPFAFCDGLTIYWWSRKVWAGLLMLSLSLIAISNAILLTGIL